MLSLVLEILFKCVGCLPAPTLFLLLPIFFFCERNTELGRWRLQLLFCLYCWHKTLGKAVSFLGFSLVDGGCGLDSFLGLLPHSEAMWDLHIGQKAQAEKEARLACWCWCWCVPPSSVSVLDKQFELLLFQHFLEQDYCFFQKQLVGICESSCFQPWIHIKIILGTLEEIVMFLAHLEGMI